MIVLSLCATVLWLLSFTNLAWNTWEPWDRIATVVSFVMLIAVYLVEAAEDWEQELPLRLDAYFVYQGQTIMVCYGAHLPHEGDIRNWAQQIGFQMSGNQRLNFSPYIDLQMLGIEHHSGQSCKRYQAVFYLKEHYVNPTPDPLTCKVWRPSENQALECTESAADNQPVVCAP